MRIYPYGCFTLLIQLVYATHWLNRSAGVSTFSILLGLSFSRLATAFNNLLEMPPIDSSLSANSGHLGCKSTIASMTQEQTWPDLGSIGQNQLAEEHKHDI